MQDAGHPPVRVAGEAEGRLRTRLVLLGPGVYVIQHGLKLPGNAYQ